MRAGSQTQCACENVNLFSLFILLAWSIARTLFKIPFTIEKIIQVFVPKYNQELSSRYYKFTYMNKTKFRNKPHAPLIFRYSLESYLLPEINNWNAVSMTSIVDGYLLISFLDEACQTFSLLSLSSYMFEKAYSRLINSINNGRKWHANRRSFERYM